MSDFIQKQENLNQHKPNIISSVQKIQTRDVSKTQAQNLREYANQTQSVDEILLYLDYQCARDRRLKNIGDELKRLINQYKGQDIGVVRYLLGTFARWVLIQSKRSE